MDYPFQDKLLRKHGYEPIEGEFVLYGKRKAVTDLSLFLQIEIYPNENPDNFGYRGLVSLLSPEGDTLADWDSERKYRLLDVILGCERIERLMSVIHKRFDTTKQ